MTTTLADPTEFGFKTSLAEALAANWWLIFVRGIIAIFFGVAAITLNLTALGMVYLIGAFALADGVFSAAAGIRGGGAMPRWWMVVVGLAGVAAALFAIFLPEAMALVLMMFIGLWSIVKGLFEIVGAVALRKEMSNEWMLLLGGVLSVVFGFIVVIAPVADALSLLWLVGGYAMVSGVMLVFLARRLRQFRPGKE
jgi:uncharacterized membrane protein HdeD (DUF308 family)